MPKAAPKKGLPERIADSLRPLHASLPLTFKATAVLRAFGFFRVPLLFSVRPRVLRLDGEACVVRIPLKRWTKNHLGSMYFGSLAIGADCVVGLLGLHLVRERGGDVVLAFKDFQAEFLKRPEGHVLFVCEEGRAMGAFVDRVLASPERQNESFQAYAVVEGSTEPVARFALTLSLKRRA
jgi:hypothetical protein